MRIFSALAGLPLLALVASTAMAQQVAVPSKMLDFCDLQPASIGDLCAKVLDDYQATATDPTPTLPAGVAVAGDAVLTSPDWSAAVLVRETRKGAAALAWPDGKTNDWTASNYSTGAAGAAPASGPAKVNASSPVSSPSPAPASAPPVATETPPVAAEAGSSAIPAPQPVAAAPVGKLTKGWMTDISTADGVFVATWYDDDDFWLSSDAVRVMPFPNSTDNYTFTRRTKLVIDKEGDFEFGVKVSAPDTTRPDELDKSAKLIGNGVANVSEGSTRRCNTAIFLDAESLVDNSGILALQTGAVLDFKSPTITLQTGVYDLSVNVSCERNDPGLAARVAYAAKNGLTEAAISYGFEATVTSTDGTPANVGVDDTMRAAGLPGAMATKLVKEPRVKLPDGYDAGWVVTRYPGGYGVKPEQIWGYDHTLQNGGVFPWPNSIGQVLTKALPASAVKFSVFNLAVIGERRDCCWLQNNFSEFAGLFTAKETGTYTFAVVNQHETATECSRSDVEGRTSLLSYSSDDADEGFPVAMFRMEAEIKAAREIRGYRTCYTQGTTNATRTAVALGDVYTPALVAFDLEAGTTYRLSILFGFKNYLGYKVQGDKAEDGQVRFFVRAPNDPALRPLKSYEILHKVGATGETG